MQHLGTSVLETPRLILRPFRLEDADAMYANWASDSEVTKYLTWPAHENIEVTKNILQDFVSHYSETDYYHWAITLGDNGDKPIGSIISVFDDKNEKLKMVTIGYCIGRNWWNQGIVSQAFDRVIRYHFTEVGINRIEAAHDINNPSSGRVMQKCGMKYEGTLRAASINNQGVHDKAVYSILKKEYECM